MTCAEQLEEQRSETARLKIQVANLHVRIAALVDLVEAMERVRADELAKLEHFQALQAAEGKR